MSWWPLNWTPETKTSYAHATVPRPNGWRLHITDYWDSDARRSSIVAEKRYQVSGLDDSIWCADLLELRCVLDTLLRQE